jgi:putative inorganic carbon (HCO3(-)) transporter
MDLRNRLVAVGPMGAGAPAAAEPIFPFLSSETIDSSHADWADRIGFGLFMLATAVLLLRPADSIPAMLNLPIYQVVVSACVCLSIPRLIRQLTSQSPARPITQLIFGFWICVITSHLVRGSLWDIRTGGVEILKHLIYYLLIVSWVDSPARLRQFMLCLCICTLAQTITGLLEYDGWINLSTLRSINQIDPSPGPGGASIVHRLCGIGIFNDPNDLCLLLVTSLALCFGFISYHSLGRFWFAWFLPLGFFAYTISLTHSRSGFLSLLCTVIAILIVRYGRARAFLAAAVLVPLIFALFSGRQTHMDLSDPEDTFQTRLDCWSDSMELFKSSPVFGVGQGQQAELRYHVAHNSFIQSFAELGFAGGACFLGAFLLVIRAIYQTNIAQAEARLARLHPMVLAILVSYAVGLLALSRGYTGSTYLILGLGAAYINLTPRIKPVRLNSSSIQWLCVASVAFIAATYLFVRVMRV